MQKILVAGASRGIGLGFVKAQLAAGNQVFAVARNPDNSPGLQELMGKYGKQVELIRADITSHTSVRNLKKSLEGEGLDQVVIVAGISGQCQDVAEITEEDAGNLFMTNAIAPVHLAMELAPLLRDKGVLAFLSSIMGSQTCGKSAPMPLYSASKAALNNLVISWKDSFEHLPFSILLLHPGWVKTDMGGGAATLSVEDSVSGLLSAIQERAGNNPQFGFLDYKGRDVPL